MWCHLPTSFIRRLSLPLVAIAVLCSAAFSALLLVMPSHAAPNVTRPLNFQGRLLTKTGSVVADGYYNIEFKIYQGGDGTQPHNPGGVEKWHETYVNGGGNNGILVKNGMFSVQLGSKDAFGTSVDWNQANLWLSMNVAGKALDCATFGQGTCAADGEMTPMKQITATPYALNAGALEGKTAANFVQIAQGMQDDNSNYTSSIAVNKTGIAGSFLELQRSGKDIFSIKENGNLEFGHIGDEHEISVQDAPSGQDGDRLTIRSGYGGSGGTTNGGELYIQAGGAGGGDGTGGNVGIDAGEGSGSGQDGYIGIGTSFASNIGIGSNWKAINQNIEVGSNNTAGSTTNVTIGAGGDAAGGTTNIRSKDDTTISTNGEQRARFSSDGTLYVGNADESGSAETANSFTIQGTSSTATNAQGGSIAIQAGAATNGNANGGNLTLSGGAGVGTGATGLVVINTPTFQATNNDANCYTGSALVANDCTFAKTSVDSSSVLIAGFSVDGKTATLPDPTNTTAGRIMYVTAANSSKDFSLKVNVGGGAGVEQTVTMRQNTSATLIWNGGDWTFSGGLGNGTLQDAYNSSVQSDANGMIVNTAGSNGLTIRNNNDTSGNSILSVESATKAPLLSVTSTSGQLATNTNAETAGGSADTFPANTWSNSGIDAGGDENSGMWDALVTRNTDPAYINTGNASVKVKTHNTWTGATNKLNAKLTPGATYSVTATMRTESSTLSHMEFQYMPTGSPSEDWVGCSIDNVVTTTWNTYTCTFQIPTTGINTPTIGNKIYMDPRDETGTFYIDNLSVTRVNSTGTVKIGSDTEGADPTLLTLNKSATPLPADDSDSLLGSMYYDTTLGKVRCYQASGWGNCSDAPNQYVTLSPAYPNSVATGPSLALDFCSSQLHVNDSTHGNPVCVTGNESYNYYDRYTDSTDPSMIYTQYKLPANFKNFVPGSTSILARTNGTGAEISYKIYRKDTSSGLTACGSTVTASSGNQTNWQTSLATGAEPADCNFKAGDTILFNITLSGPAWVPAVLSDINFTLDTSN